MEDISRELEREIALSKPKPYKQDRKTSILIVDDFGRMSSGQYLKSFVTVLSFVSLVLLVAAGLLFYLYTGLSRNSGIVQEKLVVSQERVKTLTREKEVLMARLVISGKKPDIQPDSKNEPVPTVSLDSAKKEKGLAVDLPKAPLQVPLKAKPVEPQVPAAPAAPAVPVVATAPAVPVKKTISVEKFTVTRAGGKGDLLVRFDIRNMSEDQGDVAGRIFTLLKPDNSDPGQWLVVPASPLNEGVPTEYKKGQYFSIAHFKPVKFRIKNQADPEFFKKATIFIFNNKGDLIFEHLIPITEAKPAG